MSSAGVRSLFFLAIVWLLPPLADSTGKSQSKAQQLSALQEEVWKQELSLFQYLQERDLKKYMSLWDDHFVGWPDYHEHAVSKQEIESEVAEEFRKPKPAVESTDVLKLESVAVSGDIAITYYFWAEADESPTLGYRVTHTWRKGPAGWHIIGGMGCAIPRQGAKH